MNKVIICILSFFLIFLFSCAYEPILNNKNYLFSINVNKTNGNEQVNSIIINKFNSLKKNEKKYDLTLLSSYEKNIISKDNKGDPSVFELIINVEYSFQNYQGNLIKKNIIKKSTYNNISDKFELEKFENVVINNLSTSISENIISSMSNLK